MYQNINENYIKAVLQEHDEKLKIISNRTFALYKEFEKTDTMISEVAYQQRPDFSERQIKAKELEGLDKVMQKHVDLVRNRSKEIQSVLWQLTEEEETINRIWVCFNALCGKEYHILEEIYVKNQKYVDVQRATGFGHRKFEMLRKQAINQILYLYKSKLSNLEIVKRRVERKEENTEENESYTQLTFTVK